MKHQARFWVALAGCACVRVKLDADQSVSHSEGGPTDEGYSWIIRTWTYDGAIVTLQWRRDSRDCDGRYTSHGESHCNVRDLETGSVLPESIVPYGADLIRFPRWSHERTFQRDHSAEAMGY